MLGDNELGSSGRWSGDRGRQTVRLEDFLSGWKEADDYRGDNKEDVKGMDDIEGAGTDFNNGPPRGRNRRIAVQG